MSVASHGTAGSTCALRSHAAEKGCALAAGLTPTSWEGEGRGYRVIPDARHSVEAVEDSAVLLMVAIVDVAGGGTTRERNSGP